MNILQILPQLRVGGVETGTVDLAKYLVATGHKCVVVSAGGELVKELESCGVKHYTLPVDNKAFWIMMKSARQLQKIVMDEKIDIIHARSRVPAWVGFMAARHTDTCLITTAHGSYSKHIFSYMMGWGKYTILPSSVIGRRMHKDFGVPLENIKLIPRSVDLERYKYRQPVDKPKKDFLIALVGRITPIKGQIYFLKAFSKVLRSYPTAKAWIIGSVSSGKDDYMEELEVLTRRLGLSKAVEFLRNRRDIPELLSQADCLVMPSIAEESFGRVIVEAQATGVPVVATRVKGVIKIVEDGTDGLLVYPKDPEGLAQGIEKIFKDHHFALAMAEKGRKKVEERFTLEKMAQDTLKVYEEALSRKRILVIKMSALGDCILSIPSFEALKKKFPDSKITCLVELASKDVFKRCPYIDELIVTDLKGRDKGFKGLWRLMKKLAGERFDMVIDFQNNKKSHMLAFSTFAFDRYGYDNGKFSFLLNKKIKDTGSPLPPVQHQFRVLDMLGIGHLGEALKLWLSEEDKRFSDDFFKTEGLGGRVIGINIGSSLRWKTKRWPTKKIAELCDLLSMGGYRVLLTGSAHDAPYAKAVLKQVKSRPACAVARTSLMQLAGLIQKCACFVTSDSAPLHIASAMGTPVVALFGPTDPARHMPPSEKSIVLKSEICTPCYKDECKRKTHSCMDGIKTKQVFDSIESLLR
ncbi:MAG TPA: lipopolysaccharide heptosyltransferase II [Candidatus Omnitrophota bacterium]|nr:lipopolysaccharide heptosyltransferase II [Candidatus Omnitrophota bacterium]